MKQFEINKAYGALTHMANMELPVRVAYDVYMLMKALEPTYKFELERERLLVQKYNGEVSPDGMIKFAAPEDAESFRNEVNELNMMDVEPEYTPITIPYDAMEGHPVTPLEIASLEGFVSFE